MALNPLRRDGRAATLGVALPVIATVAAAAVGSMGSLAAGPVATGPLRALVTLFGAVCLGCAFLVLWVPDRADATWRVMAGGAVAWFVIAVAEFTVRAADIVGIGAMSLTTDQMARLLRDTSLGQWGWVGVVCPLVLTVVALDAARGGQGWHPAIPGTLAGVGLFSGPITGHLMPAPSGQFVIAAHVLGATAWLGPIAVAGLVLRTPDQWSRFLSRFTTLALFRVATLLASGAAATVLRLRTSALTDQWWTLLLVKIGGTVVLIALGWHHRRTWVREVTPHTTSARRAVVEATLLATLVGIAAALGHTP